MWNNTHHVNLKHSHLCMDIQLDWEESWAINILYFHRETGRAYYVWLGNLHVHVFIKQVRLFLLDSISEFNLCLCSTLDLQHEKTDLKVFVIVMGVMVKDGHGHSRPSFFWYDKD